MSYYIRSIAAATAIIAALAFATAPARACDERFGPCKSVQPQAQAAPLSLSQFLKRSVQTTAAPAAAKPQARATKPRTRTAAKPAARPAIADGFATPNAGPAPVLASEFPPPSSRGSETDGVAITSAEDLNELDAAADTVRIVAANEVNEIDLATESIPAPPQNATVAIHSAESSPQAPEEASWIGKVLAALGGVLAVASAARLLVA